MRALLHGTPSPPLRAALEALRESGVLSTRTADGSPADVPPGSLVVLPAGGRGDAIAALRAADGAQGVRIAVYGRDARAAIADLEAGADLWLDDAEDARLLEARLAAAVRSLGEEAVPSVDPVTGLEGETTFLELLGEEFRRAERYRRPLAVAVAEIGNGGPERLRLAAALVAGTVREADRTGRLRGTRLGVLMPESDAQAGLALARRLSETFAGRDENVAPEARFGIASFPARGIEGPGHLLGRACEALVQARHGEPGRALAFGDPSIVWAREAPDPETV